MSELMEMLSVKCRSVELRIAMKVVTLTSPMPVS